MEQAAETSSPSLAPFRTVSSSDTPVSTGGVVGGTKSPLVTTEAVDLAPTLTSYQEIKGRPYTADYFGLEPFLSDPTMNGTQSDINYLDEFVRSEIAQRGLTDSTDAYEEIINSLKEQIGSYDNEKPLEQFRRLATAAQAIARLRSAQTKPMLNGDNLTLKEFEIIHGGSHGR